MRPTLRSQPAGDIGLPAYSTDGVGANAAGETSDSKTPVTKRSSSFFGRMFSSRTEEEWNEKNDELMYQRWGSSDSLNYKMVQRYWLSQRVSDHWQTMYKKNPRQFAKYLNKGYMEPIPTEVLPPEYCNTRR